MHPKRTLSREKPLRTLIRANNFDAELKDIRCGECGKILFQSFSDVHIVVPGHPDTEIDPALLDPNTLVLQCHGMLVVQKNGDRINTRCGTRYFVT